MPENWLGSWRPCRFFWVAPGAAGSDKPLRPQFTQKRRRRKTAQTGLHQRQRTAEDPAKRPTKRLCRRESRVRTNNVPRATGFIVKPGFKVELVAESPVVASPVAMAFDERGRLFVVEMRDYPNRRNSNPHLGRVRLLEDPDGIGLFKSSTVFADGLAMPSGLACFKGGVFVAASPGHFLFQGYRWQRHCGGTQAGLYGLWRYQRAVDGTLGEQSDLGAGLPDSRFGRGIGRHHHVRGGCPGGERLPRDRTIFHSTRLAHVSPRNPGSGNSGLAFDDGGRKFIGDLNRPLQQVMLDWRYVARNPFLLETEGTVPVISPATAIFRYSAAAAHQSDGRNQCEGAKPTPRRWRRHGCRRRGG